MNNESKVIQIPQHEIDALARCLLPDLIAFYESENGQKEFEEHKNQFNKKAKTNNFYAGTAFFSVPAFSHNRLFLQ